MIYLTAHFTATKCSITKNNKCNNIMYIEKCWFMTKTCSNYGSYMCIAKIIITRAHLL